MDSGKKWSQWGHMPRKYRIEIWIPGLPSFPDKEGKLSPRNEEMEKINKKGIQGWGNMLDFGTSKKDYCLPVGCWNHLIIWCYESSVPSTAFWAILLLFSCSVVSDSLQPLGDYSPPGSSVHEIFQARILEWVAMPFSRGPSQPKDQTSLRLLHYRWILYHWATWEAPQKIVNKG